MNDISRLSYKINPCKKHWIHVHKSNCYAYALGLDIKENKIMKDAYKPGIISHYEGAVNRHLFSYQDLVTSLYKDMEVLGISITKTNPDDILDIDEWLIALYISRYASNSSMLSDFHFLRKLPNDCWSHKMGYHNRPTCYDDNHHIITDLDMCYLKNRQYDSCYSLKLKINHK